MSDNTWRRRMVYSGSGENIKVLIQFIMNQEFFTPDVGSVTYTLKNNLGVAIVGQVDIPVVTDLTTTEITLTLLGVYNTKDIANDFENRFIKINGTIDGAPFTLRSNYRIIDSSLFVFDLDMVRKVIGITSSELEDSDIDVYPSYFALKEQYGTRFVSAFSSGTMTAFFVEAAVYLDTALRLLPSLRLVAVQTESDGAVRVSRFSDIEWGQVKADLLEKLEEALIESGAVISTGTVEGKMSSYTDYFTG